MCSKQQLKTFLEEISPNAQFHVFKYVSAEQFSIVLKCRVENDRNATFYSEYAKEWIKKFSKFTKTSWNVRKCFPKLKRLLYRKIYVCHLSSHNKTKLPRQTAARNKECGAKIDFKMKFINRNTIKNDKSLKEGLNLNIYIDFTHTHGIRAWESFNLLKCSSDTDAIFYKYFSDGHTVPTAKSYHELTLLSKYGAASEEYLTTSQINPTLRHITYLYRKKKGEYKHNIADTMAEKKQVLEDSGGVMRYTDDYSITVVITPFMKNVLTGHDLDFIIIDSTPLKDIVVSFFLVPSPLGALPIACALHSQNTEPSFSQAFFSTKLLLENQTLKSFEPKKIMINVIDEQSHALDAIFSNKMLFLSRRSMVEEIWRVICDGEIKIEGRNQHNLMLLFYSLLYAEDLEEMEKYYQELEADKLVECTPKLKEYLSDIWNRRDNYIIQDQNKVIDISVRVLKQFLLHKCNSYNSLVMIDVLLNILDKHWCQILHAHLKGKLIIETYTIFLPKNRKVMNTLNLKITENEYKLDSETKARRLIRFRSDTLCCDCLKGRKGRLCEHLCAVLHSIDLTTEIPEEKRDFYVALAGEDVKNNDLKFEPEIENEQDTNDMEEAISNNGQSAEYFFVVKEEMDDNSDPLENKQNEDDNCMEIDVNNMKNNYENTLKALNDEFRRLNKVFKQNPNNSNLDTMGRLARELSKIRPVEKLNLSNMFIKLNDEHNMDRNE